jgi:hypothetical protein
MAFQSCVELAQSRTGATTSVDILLFLLALPGTPVR